MSTMFSRKTVELRDHDVYGPLYSCMAEMELSAMIHDTLRKVSKSVATCNPNSLFAFLDLVIIVLAFINCILGTELEITITQFIHFKLF